MKSVLAFDFGASSGRAILAQYDGGKLTYQEVHRFENTPQMQKDHLRWDFSALLKEVHMGIKKAGKYDSIAFDTWGVDFGLLDENGQLLELPVHYRDGRTDGILKKAYQRVPKEKIYQRTGIQILPHHTLFQLFAMREQEPEQFARAKRLLFMPDLFIYALCGNPVCESAIASTSQMMDVSHAVWASDLLDAFEIPSSLLLPVSGSRIVGQYQGANVIAVAGHDTQCAVAALPSTAHDIAFLSCGTWSLLGCEISEPIYHDQTFSNELGVNGKINYLKNIIGLWLVQESRREWRRQGKEYSYKQLEEYARSASPWKCFVNPDDPVFTAPGDIPSRIREFCKKTAQPEPNTVGEIMRCIYESLALKYRYVLEKLSRSTGKDFSVLHVLGGGTKDPLLCQMTANACGIPVVAGPVEATALGNIMIQLKVLGELPDISAGRMLIQETESLKTYDPMDRCDWNMAYQKYLERIGDRLL